MMGKDSERVIACLNKLKDEVSKQIDLLARKSDHRMETIEHSHNASVINAPHGHPTGAHSHMVPGIAGPTGAQGSDGYVSKQLTYAAEYSNDKHRDHPHTEAYIIYEREHPVSASTYTNPIVNIGKDLNKDLEKMKKIEEDMYTDKSKFNTQYGSPWKEIYILKEKIDIVEKYASDFPQLQWLGEKHSLLSLMQIVLSYTIDAKWAFTYYHDWMQRAYDHKFNNNEPSLVWDKFDKKTIGQWNQTYDENVNIKEESEDPY
jgi:hypothetical protein